MTESELRSERAQKTGLVDPLLAAFTSQLTERKLFGSTNYEAGGDAILVAEFLFGARVLITMGSHEWAIRLCRQLFPQCFGAESYAAPPTGYQGVMYQYNEDKVAHVWLDTGSTLATVAHEAAHVAFWLGEVVGIKPGKRSEEFFTYYTGFLVRAFERASQEISCDDEAVRLFLGGDVVTQSFPLDDIPF